MKNSLLLFIAGLIFIMVSCKNNLRHGSRVIITPMMWNRETMVLRAVPFINEEHPYVDSIKVNDTRKQIIFTIPDTLQRVYELSVKGRAFRIQFVNDVPEIYIKADFLGSRDSTRNSPATTALKNINEAQEAYNLKLQEIAGIQEKIVLKYNKKYLLELQQQYTAVVKQKNQNAIQVMDTVTNPAVWMAVYNKVDFDKNFKALSKVMSSAAERFPAYKPIRILKSETDNYISIYTEELQVGNTLPFINLPDQNNVPFSTQSLAGKFYYIDFWASWCAPCMPYSEPKREAYNLYSKKNFRMVSVFLDDNTDAWKNIINSEHFNWTQLIDKKQWSGPAVRALKFDSIPFNYLVNPQGKIIAKAIAPGNLLKVLKTKLK